MFYQWLFLFLNPQSEELNLSDVEGEEESFERGSELLEMSFATKKTSSTLMPKPSSISAPARLPPKVTHLL